MLDGLLNRGFSSKCKSLIKATRTRIAVVRRRAEAKQSFLKEDLAKLLTNGLDINAYGRTEEFLAGLNLLACYDFIEASCDYVVKNLSNMQKQSECPEGCREAVASLMFAAARFSDLPELRDVRDIFQQRYGSSLECFVNQKFVEKLSSKPPLTETRLQLLQDIATECSIKWDSRGFELRMTTPPSITAQAQANKYGHYNGVVDKCNLLDGRGSVAKSDEDDVLPKEIPVRNIGHKMHHDKEGNDAANHDDSPCYAREQDRIAKHERRVKKDLISSKVEKTSSSSYRRPLEGSGIAYPGQDEAKNDVQERENWNPLSRGKMSVYPNFAIPEPNIKGNSTAANHDDRPLYDREQDRIVKHERRVKKDLISTKVEKTSSSSYRRPLEGSGIAYPGQDEAKNDVHGRENLNPLSRGKMSVSPNFGGIPEPNIKGNSTAANHDDSPGYNREQDIIAKNERRVKMDLISSKVEKTGSSSYRRPLEGSSIAYPGQDEAKNDLHERENWKPLSREKMSVSPNFGGIPGKNEGLLFSHEHGGITGNSQKEAKSTKRAQNEEVDGSKAYHNTPRPPPYVKSSSNAVRPPPYVKPKDSKKKTSRRSEHEGPYHDEHLMNPPAPNRVDEINGSDWNKIELDNPVHEGQINGSARIRSREKEHLYQDDTIPLPKPRSRRKHHKSLSNYDDVSHVEDSGTGRKSSSSRRRDQPRKGLQILMDIEHYRKDEEEKMIDKLLLHYSKKPSTYEDVGKSRKNFQACPSYQGTLDAGESSHDPKTDGYNVKPEITPAPTRSVSLPHVHSGPSGAKKIFARANSFQPDNQAPHVHPKLPDYDDLAAQFAALKGR